MIVGVLGVLLATLAVVVALRNRWRIGKLERDRGAELETERRAIAAGAAAFENQQRGKIHDHAGWITNLDERTRQLEDLAGLPERPPLRESAKPEQTAADLPAEGRAPGVGVRPAPSAGDGGPADRPPRGRGL